MSPRAIRRHFAPKLVERPVQRGAIQLLTMHGFEVVHVPNGPHLAGDKVARAKQMAALKADGLRPGFPDLLVFGRRPLEFGLLECKREGKHTIDPDQEECRGWLEARGWPWALVQLPEDALSAVRRWGWL